jgi:hypothetical protein
MHRSVPLALVALLAVSACSKPATNGAAGASGSATPAAASAPVGTVCDRKIIVAADIAPLLSEPIAKQETLSGDGQSCVFTSTGFSSVTVSIRPGLGDTSVDLIKSGKTNQTVTPLAGVGDRAVWDAELKEVDATKSNTLCTISAIGPATKPATSDKVGALCNKIFAAS